MTTVVFVAECAGDTRTPVTAIAEADAKARTARALMRVSFILLIEGPMSRGGH